MEQKQQVSLQDLLNEKKSLTVESTSKTSSESLEGTDLVEVDPSQIAPMRPTIEQEQVPEIEKAMDRLDAALDRTKEELKPIIEKGKSIIRENMIRKAEEQEEANLGIETPSTSNNEVEVQESKDKSNLDDIINDAENIGSSQDSVNINNIDIAADDTIEDTDEPDEAEEEIIDEDDEEAKAKKEQEEEDARAKAAREKLKPLIKAVIKPVTSGIDISKFTIKSKPIAYSRVLATKGKKAQPHVSDWVLPNTGKSISMREFSGSEIAQLNPNNSSQNAINTQARIYSLIYSHIEDANKPKTLEEWLKSICFYDIKHLYFAVYKASFENANYFPYMCDKKECNEPDLVKLDIMDMVKFGKDAKERFDKIFAKDTTSSTYIEEKLILVSDDYAISVRMPTLYNVVFEGTIINSNQAFKNKYEDAIANLSFIGDIYKVDVEAQELIPIDVKADPNDLRKTVQNKIKIYFKILNSLNSDQYAIFTEAINELDQTGEVDISYCIPKHTCPNCGTLAEETPIPDPLSLVFMRHQLTLVANS